MTDRPPYRPSGWIAKFRCAFRGVAVGVRTQNSFLVHLPVAIAVVVAAWLLEVTRTEWCLLILAIGLVIAAELFNSAVENLAKAVTTEENPHIRNALDIASAAVLVAAMAAIVIGLIVLGGRLLAFMN